MALSSLSEIHNIMKIQTNIWSVQKKWGPGAQSSVVSFSALNASDSKFGPCIQDIYFMETLLTPADSTKAVVS